MQLENFIGTWKNFIDKEDCLELIRLFENERTQGNSKNRQESEDIVSLLKSDEFVRINQYSNYMENDSIKKFLDLFWNKAHKQYSQKYGIMNIMSSYNIINMQLQKTLPEEGYHVWHSENILKNYSNRIMTFILYLNDVDIGGETEFLYLSKRINPEQGKLILWPAGYTHTHRGNPPLSGKKYVLTGWLEFV